jgi:membrane protein
MAPIPVNLSASLAACDQGVTIPREAFATGWRDIILHFKNGMRANNIYVVAAGVAFFAHLSIFAALAVIVAIYALLTDPREVSQHSELFADLLSQEARAVLTRQLSAIFTGPHMRLGISLAAGVLVTLWSARSAIRTLMAVLNIVYGEEEQYGFFKVNAIALLLTLVVVALIIVALACHWDYRL